MQPLGLATDAKAGLVEMLDRGGEDALAQHGGDLCQPRGTSVADVSNRRGGELDAEQIGHRGGEAILGQQLIVRQIDHDRGDALAILHRRIHPGREGAAAQCAAAPAGAVMGAVFGGDEAGGRLGQVKDLSGAVTGGHGRRHCRAAARAGRRQMIDHLIGNSDLEQGLALVAFLPARGPSRWLARAPRPVVARRLSEPVTRRRLAAV
jgi:hypothetical protein